MHPSTFAPIRALVLLAITTLSCADLEELDDGQNAELREKTKPQRFQSGQLPKGQDQRGKNIFRDETFNDEALWTDELELHLVLPTLSPADALGLGLKVDADALPNNFDLASATVVDLLKLDAVIGVKAKVTNLGRLESVGVTCALCHTDVDDSLGFGIGTRLDGFPNRDLDVGAILSATGKIDDPTDALLSWGPGFYDPRWNFNPLETTVPALIPPAYGLAGVPLETYTGDGPVSYWNNYVAVTQMGGQGAFVDERIPLDIDNEQEPDLVHPRLPALLAYQLSLEAPRPDPGSIDQEAAARGQAIFNDPERADCARCHKGETFTDAGETLHEPAEVGQDGAYAARSVTGMYRTTPLRGLLQHPPYFHDGGAPDLLAVVNHYDDLFGLGLTDAEKADLIAYLETL